jgi:hypothetical protein
MMAKIIRLKTILDKKEDKNVKVAMYLKEAIKDDYNVEENIQFILKNSELGIKDSLKADLDNITKDIFKLYGLNVT